MGACPLEGLVRSVTLQVNDVICTGPSSTYSATEKSDLLPSTDRLVLQLSISLYKQG
jgi:hypothetical protein